MINFLKFFYSKESLKRKVYDILDDIRIIIKSICKDKFWINCYGAYDIDPKNMIVWICVDLYSTKSRLKSDGELAIKLKEVLIKHNYPEKARPYVNIGFESQETVDKESKENWYEHFK